MKKILLFTDSLGAGGAQRQLCGLAVMLSTIGYNVKVCIYHHEDFYKTFLDERGVSNEVVMGAGNKFLRIFKMYRYFKREHPDYVIAYQEIPSLIACLAKLFGCHFNLLVSERNTTQVLKLSDRLRFNLYHTVNAVIPNSFSQEEFLRMNYKWMTDKIYTITNFVDLSTFEFCSKKKNIEPLIVVAASVWPPKNVKGFIEALRLLVRRNVNFKIEWYGLVPGHEQYVDECMKLIEEYSIHDYIELLPKTSDIKSKYEQCDFFCLPSFYEGTPNVICEAMAVGRPVICSNVCDNPCYIEQNINGFLFDPCSVEDIADKIERAILMSDDQYECMCVNNRMKAEDMFSKEIFIEKYLNLLEN